MKNEEDMKNKDQEINRKRKNNNQDFHHLTTTRFSDFDDEENDMLTLSLNSYCPSRPKRIPPPVDPPLQPPSPPLSIPMPGGFMQTLMAQTPPHHPLQLSTSHPLYITTQQSSPTTTNSMPSVYHHQEQGPGLTPPRTSRVRRNPTQAPRQGKGETVPAPFPWATTKRATVHTLAYLKSRQIVIITGDVQCKRCERRYEMEYNLEHKFLEVGTYIAVNKVAMSDRAPSKWNNPVLPACKFCEQANSVKPIMAEKKKMINWLFLLLGQMIGCCTLEQLKYFCKHTKNHRTCAKDRLLYLTYLGLCKQLDPEGPFSR